MGIKEFNERWLVNGIEEDYKSWLPRGVVSRQKASRIFIESPTGTGKSSFVLDKLFPFAAEKNYNILYLANRSALNQQIRNAVARKLKVKGKISHFLFTRVILLPDRYKLSSNPVRFYGT